MHNANGRNLYWTVNIVCAGLHKKPGKEDIRQARFVHVDIDPPKDGSPFNRKGALSKLDPLDPTFVIDSGGGLQAFWRLDDRCGDLLLIEDINTRVRDLFDADACQNIDRLMRVPGTVNWPDAKKRARGRVPALASVICTDTGETVEADHRLHRLHRSGGATARRISGGGGHKYPSLRVVTDGVPLLTHPRN